MEISADSSTPVQKRPRGRSRFTNQKSLLLCDARSAIARRFRDVYEQIIADLGGPDALSEGQRQLARRAGMLSSICEGMEALAVQSSGDFDCEAFGVLCDRLGRLLQRLGLERKTREANARSLTLAAEP